MKRRRMPYVAKTKRDDPFRSTDRREIDAMVKRIAAVGETFSIAGWREDAGFLLFHFPTWAKARAMQHCIDRSGIANRPMPALQRAAARRRQRCGLIFYCDAAARPGRQNDQAQVVGATINEPGLFGVPDRLLEGQTRKANVTADAFSSPPGMRALDTNGGGAGQ